MLTARSPGQPRRRQLPAGLVGLLVATLAATACGNHGGSTSTSAQRPASAAQASWPTRGWRTAAPQDHGINPSVLTGIDNQARTAFPGLRSVLVVRGGEREAPAGCPRQASPAGAIALLGGALAGSGPGTSPCVDGCPWSPAWGPQHPACSNHHQEGGHGQRLLHGWRRRSWLAGAWALPVRPGGGRIGPGEAWNDPPRLG